MQIFAYEEFSRGKKKCFCKIVVTSYWAAILTGKKNNLFLSIQVLALHEFTQLPREKKEAVALRWNGGMLFGVIMRRKAVKRNATNENIVARFEDGWWRRKSGEGGGLLRKWWAGGPTLAMMYLPDLLLLDFVLEVLPFRIINLLLIAFFFEVKIFPLPCLNFLLCCFLKISWLCQFSLPNSFVLFPVD